MMRWIYCFLFFITCITVTEAQSQKLLQKEIELPLKNCSLQQVFEKLEAQNILTAYNNKSIQQDKTIHLPFSKTTVAVLLQWLKKEHNIDSKIRNNKIIFTKLYESYTISGYIKEKGSGETLAGANISIDSGVGTFSNAYGFYSLTLPEGTYQLYISYIGYIPQQTTLVLNQNKQLDIELKPASQQISEIVVKPQQSSIHRNKSVRINLTKTNFTPMALGADDAIKRLQIIPGTGGGITGFSDITVRGGNVHENLVLLDGVPIYNYNHFPGILSVFNTEALKSIDFYKGQFPARYGGRLSSVTDIKMREGNMQNYHIGGSIDLATGALFVEGPIIKNKASFIASGRRSWIDELTKLGNNDEEFNFHLQDINLKANFLPTDDDRIYISFYRGVDKLGNAKDIEETETLSWYNNIGALRWNHTFSNRLFGNALLYAGKFKNVAKSLDETISNSDVITNKYVLKEFNLSFDLEYYSEWYQLRFGIGAQKNIFEIPLQDNTSAGKEIAVQQWKSYVENKVQFNADISANIGLNHILYCSKEMKKHFFQPRINLNYKLNANADISIGFSEMYQFIHQLGSYSINFPYAFRLPASEIFMPGISRLYELKYITKLRQKKDNFSASLYYKRQRNILRYRPGQDIFNKQLADDWEKQVLHGKRKIAGAEISYYADLSPLQINFSYTYAKNKEQFMGINNNQYYPNALTPKHTLLFTAVYAFNKKHSVSALAEYNTGRYMTIPIYEIGSIDDAVNHTASNKRSYVSGKINGFQLKDNYHLDLGYTFQSEGGKNGKHIFKVGINNLLGRLAPFRTTATVWEKQLNIEEVSLPALMPYVSYTFKF